MRFGGARADEKFRGDVRIAQAFGGELKNKTLAFGQFRRHQCRLAGILENGVHRPLGQHGTEVALPAATARMASGRFDVVQSRGGHNRAPGCEGPPTYGSSEVHGQHEHARGGMLVTDAAHDFEASTGGDHQVEQQHVRLVLLHQLDRLQAILASPSSRDFFSAISRLSIPAARCGGLPREPA